MPVESSTFASVGYERATGELELEFRHGAIYVYSAVPPSAFEGLMEAESKGRFFNSHVRDVYTCLKVSR